jgi:type IV fimbrial biogenesis protein FimT
MRLIKATLMKGFTLIELMIALAIFAFLAMLAVPMYGEMLANTEVRTAAESVLSGVRLAQTEAVRRSVPVRFELVNPTGWRVVFHADETLKVSCAEGEDGCTADTHIKAECAADSECIIRESEYVAGAKRAEVSSIDGGTAVTFSSLGMPQPKNNDTSDALERVLITTSAISEPRKMHVVIGGLSGPGSGGTKLCDIAVPTTDPMGCPPL